MFFIYFLQTNDTTKARAVATRAADTLTAKAMTEASIGTMSREVTTRMRPLVISTMATIKGVRVHADV